MITVCSLIEEDKSAPVLTERDRLYQTVPVRGGTQEPNGDISCLYLSPFICIPAPSLPPSLPPSSHMKSYFEIIKSPKTSPWQLGKHSACVQPWSERSLWLLRSTFLSILTQTEQRGSIRVDLNAGADQTNPPNRRRSNKVNESSWTYGVTLYRFVVETASRKVLYPPKHDANRWLLPA